jgi:hypothetical protein
MHQQLWGYKVEWKSVSRGTGGKRLNTTGPELTEPMKMLEKYSIWCIQIDV